ncbi:MAG: alpha/beta hydrolase, partial [Thermoanaerobaculia bacterium]
MASVPVPSEKRRLLWSLLGDLPARDRPTAVVKRGEEDRDGYVLETLELDLNGLEPVPAYLARPHRAAGRSPAVLYNHSHGGAYPVGKTELVEGRSFLQSPAYARLLTGLGCVVLCIDHWVFGERSH